MTAVEAPAPGDETARSRRHLPLALVLLVVGVASFIVGGALAWGTDPLLGFSIGSVGTILLVVGAVLFRNAMIGRFLEGGEG